MPGRPAKESPVILAATDFSPTSAKAILWAAHWARLSRGRLVVFHAWHLKAPSRMYPPELIKRLREEAERRLGRTARGLERIGLAARPLIYSGDPDRKILEAARDVAADLIAIGTRGLTPFERTFLGRTAQHVVRKSRCPLLVIHPGDAARPRPPRTILAPSDLGGDAELEIEAAARFAGRTGVRYVALNASQLPPMISEFGVFPWPARVVSENLRHDRRRLERSLAPLRRRGFRIEAVVREGYAAETILREARARKVDLIALCTHGHSGIRRLLLGSVAERVIQHAPCPVLALRRGGKARAR